MSEAAKGYESMMAEFILPGVVERQLVKLLPLFADSVDAAKYLAPLRRSMAVAILRAAAQGHATQCTIPDVWRTQADKLAKELGEKEAGDD